MLKFNNSIQKILKIYGEMIDYSFNLIVKEYCKFPKYLPVPFHMEHGWTALSDPLSSDLRAKKKLMLVFSKRRENAWKEKSDTPVAIMGAPFVHYRRMNNIKIDPDAKGTIVFPAHSTNFTKSIYDVEKFCKELISLDESFKPISISLLSEDINRGLEKKYLDYGFNIVSAGNRYDINFPEKFYHILKNHKYATGNDVGSAAFYCAEMGIPYFVLGDIAYEENDGRDMNVALKNTIFDHKNGRIAYALFNTGPVRIISDKQNEYVYKEMGLNCCVSPQELNKLFWKYFHLYEVIIMIIKLIKSGLKKIIKFILKPLSLIK